MKQRVKVSKKGIRYIFTLPCVESITKMPDNMMMVIACIGGRMTPAFEGDWLCENDNGEWSIERQ